MKRTLTIDDVKAAVLGGAILGGGGGGILEAGERAATLAMQVGTPQLWSVDEFDGQDRRAGGAEATPAPSVPVWHEPASQGVRAWFFRVLAVAGPYLPRRAPRTTL